MTENTDSGALSGQTRARLATELADLRKQRDRMAAELTSDHDTVGDQGDAADDLERADDVALIDDRIDQLEALLGGWVTPSPPGALPDGAEVTVQFPDDGIRKLRVVVIPEETPRGGDDVTLTADSPLGIALAGHQPGDTVTYMTPEGSRQVQLLAVNLPAGPDASR
ncbi:GreA/GreB family elongation factor [Rhodococcus sp. IEGM 1379]|uniref:GreA/GreB family elongation factor n=1 Tax=Rhodococcus sp. IEGM 1379 TaxID=3047086 RepID=UPI0024B637B8|nr:GreA/GreB family elongation factor [Rhodococcus sp. IEGM 1379]MDI9915794.1 GreA/GreB family elongation factor [Rhodococcus sp. IEGM 1379]